MQMHCTQTNVSRCLENGPFFGWWKTVAMPLLLLLHTYTNTQNMLHNGECHAFQVRTWLKLRCTNNAIAFDTHFSILDRNVWLALLLASSTESESEGERERERREAGSRRGRMGKRENVQTWKRWMLKPKNFFPTSSLNIIQSLCVFRVVC